MAARKTPAAKAAKAPAGGRPAAGSARKAAKQDSSASTAGSVAKKSGRGTAASAAGRSAASAAAAGRGSRSAGRSGAAAKGSAATSTKGGRVRTAASKPAAGASKRPVKKLLVRKGERAWGTKEIAAVRAELEADEARLQEEISSAELEINQLLREGGEGAGHDQADVGSNTFERDHEMSMARNAKDNLALVQAALARIADGSYGVCESCGNPIGKARLQAFPRATLCMECKQLQERR